MRIVLVGLLLGAVSVPFGAVAQVAPPPPDEWGELPAPPLVEPAPLQEFESAPADPFSLPPPPPMEAEAASATTAALPPPPPMDFGSPPPAPGDPSVPYQPAWPATPGVDATVSGASPTAHSPGTYGLAFDDQRTTRLASSTGGPIGLAHVLAAEPGPVGTLRIGLHGSFFDAAGFPVQESENQGVGGTWTLAWTPFPFLDLYGAYSLSSNRNDRSSPELIQSQGDSWFGAKAGFLAVDGLWLGADLRLAIYPAIGEVQPNAFGLMPTGLVTWDIHSVAPSVPLRFHLNFGGRFDETRDIAANPLTPAERYALDINEYDRLALAAGLEVPLPFVTPFVEFGTELPLGAPELLPQTDGEWVKPLDAAPRRVTAGGRITAVSDLSILAAIDIGLQRHVVEGIPATPPWELWLGVAYTLDPNPEEQVRVVERVTPTPAAAPAMAVLTGTVAGLVLDATTREPIPGAVVALSTAASPGLPPVATDAAAGRFVSHQLPPGPVDVIVTKEGYTAASVALAVEVGRETAAEILLTREAARPASLLVRARGPRGPVDADVTIDGPQSARLSLTNGEGQAELPAGRYRIRVGARGFLSREGTAEVADGAPTTVLFELAPKPKTTGLVFSGKKILPKRTIRFRGDSEILPSSFPYLDEVAAAMIDNGYRKLRVDAHVSTAYGDRAVAVTRERAKAVKEYLAEKAGIDPDKLVLKAWGDSAPIAPNLTEPGRKMNTRVTFTILER